MKWYLYCLVAAIYAATLWAGIKIVFGWDRFMDGLSWRNRSPITHYVVRQGIAGFVWLHALLWPAVIWVLWKRGVLS